MSVDLIILIALLAICAWCGFCAAVNFLVDRATVVHPRKTGATR